MLRLLLWPLFLFTLSMVCMGQTFQYSRGWTNGKRAPPATVLANSHNLGLLDIYDVQDTPSDRRLERCLVQLQHFVGNTLLHRSFANGLAYNANRPEQEVPEMSDMNVHNRASSSNTNNINENSLFGNANHHQSNEIFEAARVDSVEPNDYGKH